MESSNKESPLFTACSQNLSILKLLFKNGANLNIRNSSIETPLFKAAENNKIKIIKYLVSFNVDLNESNYYQNKDWLSEYFSEQGISEYYKESSLIVKDVELVYTGDDVNSKNKDDLENVIKINEAFRDRITPVNAADPLMWSALCHMDFRSYILKRWKKGDKDVRLDQRFFATEGRSSLLYYNAISRLWWSGYLTYDDDLQDPWEITRTLFSAQQIQKDLFDQSFSMNRSVVKGLLMALSRIQKETRNASTTIFRKCCDTYFNHFGAVTVVDALSINEIEQLAYDYMKEEVDIIKGKKYYTPLDRKMSKGKSKSKKRKK